MKREIIITADGSNTLYIPELSECYHSRNGAFTESLHIFIEAGFRCAAKEKNSLHILEVGFGTGLNALLTMAECKNANILVQYFAIEPYRVEKEFLEKLNFSERNSVIDYQLFNELHQSVSDKPNKLSGNFDFVIMEKMIEEIILPVNEFDLIYYDAFAPDVQPEMWTPDIFKKLYNAMKIGGILVTYSCKGDVKRALKSAGFHIEKLPGPPGKREFLRAKK